MEPEPETRTAMSMGRSLERWRPQASHLAGAPPVRSREMEIEQVPASEWEHWITTNAGVLVDVRQPEEWAVATLPGARLVSLEQIPEAMQEMDQSTAVLLVCRSGGRSQQAAMFLALSGFQTVANLAGGMKALGLQD